MVALISQKQSAKESDAVYGQQALAYKPTIISAPGHRLQHGENENDPIQCNGVTSDSRPPPFLSSTVNKSHDQDMKLYFIHLQTKRLKSNGAYSNTCVFYFRLSR